MKFYTSVYQNKNYLYVRGFRDGKRFKEKVKYQPYLFREQADGHYRTITGIPCTKVDFHSMGEANEYIREFTDVDNVTIYGLTYWVYLYIYDNFFGKIDYSVDKICITSIDIECAADEGFPDITLADKEITAISLRTKGKTLAFGCGYYEPHKENITYIKCEDEADLLTKFLLAWERLSPDIVTGWNIEFFDIPYLINRLKNILGEEAMKKISPWEQVHEREVRQFNKLVQSYHIAGISIIDYYHAYRKFKFGEAESYKLDYIAQLELGEKKIDYSEYGSLLQLYKKNFQKFIEYNIHDAELVERLEDHLGFIKQIIAVAYDAKVSYNDTFATVRPWDIIIHNYLLDRRYVVPPVKRSGNKTRSNVGGFVKEPKLGWSKWVVSFDLKSSYPHQIMQYNISPEMIAGKYTMPTIDQLINKQEYTARDNPHYSIAANGLYFRKDKPGFLAALMEQMYEDRAKANKELEELEKNGSGDASAKSILHNYQMAKKIQLNSAYGALANEFFRWYDLDLAEAITTSGQLAVRWIAKAINDYLNKALKTQGKDFVIASDTDSVYLDLEDLMAKFPVEGVDKQVKVLDHFCKERLEPMIAKSFDELAAYMNAYQQRMSMTRENIADKGIWTGKKRYVLNVRDSKGKRNEKPKLKITGIEAVRSSTPQVCRAKIYQALTIIMNEDEAALQKFIADFKNDFLTLSFEDVAFPRGVNGLAEYFDAQSLYRKGTPIQVKGSLIFNHLLNVHGIETIPPIQDGDKVKFAYLIEPNPIREAVIASHDELPAAFGLDKYIDRELQFDKAFVEPLRTVTGVINWNVKPVASLADWFN